MNEATVILVNCNPRLTRAVWAVYCTGALNVIWGIHLVYTEETNLEVRFICGFFTACMRARMGKS